MKAIKTLLKIKAWLKNAFDKVADSAIGKWLEDGGRWVWMLIGLVVGLSSCNWYNACHSGVITAIFYVVYFRIEYKKDHSWLTMLLVLLCSVAGQGLIQILTEQ